MGTPVYFDPSNVQAGRDGSQANPYRDPGELASAWRMAGGTDYYFRRGSVTNFAAAFRLAAFTSGAITVQAWGSGEPPVITAFRWVAASECVEVTVSYTPGNEASVATTPQAGTNLWRVPRQFFGLYAGEVWGAQCDIANRTGVQRTPQAAREWCEADNYTAKVVYSVGNPVAAYGGLYAATTSDANWSTPAERAAIAALQAYGGISIDGIRFERCYQWVTFQTGNPPFTTPLFKNHWVRNCSGRSVRAGVSYFGPGDMTTGRGFTGARVQDNYAENLGSSFVDTAGGGAVFNDARIERNVVNGFGRSYSNGGIYLGSVYTTAGRRVLVERNTLSGGVGGNYWPYDGHACYQEQSSRSVEFRRNFVWNCDKSFHNNIPGGDVYMAQNVGIAKASPRDPSWQAMFTTTGGDSATEVNLIGNIAVGYLRFLSGSSSAGAGVRRVKGNVALGSGKLSGNGEGSFDQAVRIDHSNTAALVVDGNQFYNFTSQWYDFQASVARNAPPYVLNAIATDPSADIAKLPVPVDPKVNYALRIYPWTAFQVT